MFSFWIGIYYSASIYGTHGANDFILGIIEVYSSPQDCVSNAIFGHTVEVSNQQGHKVLWSLS